jgi:anti-anti-sigma factor
MAPALEPHNIDLRIDPGPDGLLNLAGALDLTSRPLLHAALQRQLQAGIQRCVLDLTELSFCDSAGLATLIWADHAFPAGVWLHHPNPQLTEILRTTHLLRLTRFGGHPDHAGYCLAGEDALDGCEEEEL